MNLCYQCLNENGMTIDCHCQCRVTYLDVVDTPLEFGVSKQFNTVLKCSNCGHYVYVHDIGTMVQKHSEIQII